MLKHSDKKIQLILQAIKDNRIHASFSYSAVLDRLPEVKARYVTDKNYEKKIQRLLA